MDRNEKVRNTLLKMFQSSKVKWNKQIMWLPDKVLNQTLSQLNVLYKSNKEKSPEKT